jgi:hypothetical protein
MTSGMKRNLTILVLLFCFSLSYGQVAILQSGKVPPFRMLLANGKLFSAENLPIGKPIAIIYFSPDCEECQELTKGLLERIDEARHVSIAMITYQSVENVAGYVKKNSLNNYSNIYAGTEGSSLFVKNYFNIVTFPFMALYSKNGDLIKKYTTKEIDLDDFLEKAKFLR